MANDVADLLLKIDATTEGLRRELKKAEKAVDGGRQAMVANTKKIDKGLSSMNTGAARVGSAFKVMGAAIAAAGIGRVLGGIITTTKDFNKSMSELAAITGATGEDLDFYNEQAKLVGETTTLSASQAATAFKLIASAKPDLLETKEALVAVTGEAVLLAEAAGIDLTLAAETVGVSLNQFSAGADQASRFVNVLAAGAKFGSSEIGQTSEALEKAGLTARTAGVSFEEANAAVQMLAAGGLKGSEAGTALKKVFGELEKQTDDNFKPSVVGLETALLNLSDAGLTSTEISKMFGEEGKNAAILLSEGAPKFGALTASITGTSVAAEQAATNYDNLTGDMLRLNSANEGLAITIGEKLDPTLRAATEAASDFANDVNTFVKGGGLEDVATGAMAVAAALAVMAAPAVFAGIVAGLSAIAAGVVAIGAAALANPFGVLAVAMAAAAVLIVRNWDWVEFQLSVAMLNIKIGWAKLTGALTGAWAAMTAKISTLFTDLKNNVAASMAGIAAAAANPLSAVDSFNEAFATTKASLEDTQAATADLDAAFTESETKIAAYEKEIGILTAAHEALTAADVELEEQTKEVGSAVEDVTDSVIDSTEAIEDRNKAAEDTLTSLASELEALGLSSVELATRNALQAAGVTATSDLGVEIADLVKEIDLEKAALDKTATAAEDLQEANEKAAKASDEAWRATHTYMSDTFVDIMNNGKDAFSQIAEAFTGMIKRMVAEWAASKLMQLLGFGGTTSGGGGNPLTAMFSAAGSALSSLLGKTSQAAAQAAIANGTSTMAANAAAAAGGGTAAAGGGAIATTLSSVGTAISTSLAAAGTAISSAASSALAFMTGPAGWAILAAGALAKILDSGGTPTATAGLTMGRTAGMTDENIFQTQAFASGFAPIGFKQNATTAQAEASIQPLRDLDAAMTALTKEVGLSVDLAGHTFSGLGVEGSGPGTVLGSFVEEGKSKGTTIDKQMDKYAAEWVQAVGARNALSSSELNKIIGDGTATTILENMAKAMERMLLAAKAAEEPVAEVTKKVKKVKKAAAAVVEADETPEITTLTVGVKTAVDTVAKVTLKAAEAITESLDTLTLTVSSAATPELAPNTLMPGALTIGAGASPPPNTFSNMGPFSMADIASSIGIIDGSHFNGLSSVPFDGYRARLHKGEEVLTANDPRNANTSNEEAKYLLLEMKKMSASVKTTADILTRVTRDGDSLLTQAV